jgi:hypothetical protein
MATLLDTYSSGRWVRIGVEEQAHHSLSHSVSLACKVEVLDKQVRDAENGSPGPYGIV